MIALLLMLLSDDPRCLGPEPLCFPDERAVCLCTGFNCRYECVKEP